MGREEKVLRQRKRQLRRNLELALKDFQKKRHSSKLLSKLRKSLRRYRVAIKPPKQRIGAKFPTQFRGTRKHGNRFYNSPLVHGRPFHGGLPELGRRN